MKEKTWTTSSLTSLYDVAVVHSSVHSMQFEFEFYGNDGEEEKRMEK